MTANLPFTPIEQNEIWQFPMDYPLKVIGDASDVFLTEITDIVRTQFPNFSDELMQVNPSRTGKFYSIRLQLHFKTAQELNALYAALHQCKHIKTVI